jgi:hypothetical protein
LKTLTISVEDNDFSKLKNMINNLPYVKKIVEQEPSVNPISLVSMESLEEDWESTEDERYNQEK